MLDTIHYKKFPLTELQRKLPCSEKTLGIPVKNKIYSIQISHLILLKLTLSLNYYEETVRTMTWIRAGRSGVQILVRAREQFPLQNIQIRSSTHSGSNFTFSGSKVASADSLTTHIRLESSLKIRGVIPPLYLSPSMAHSGTT